MTSCYMPNEQFYMKIDKWIWVRTNGDTNKFLFDSDAEREWCTPVEPFACLCACS